MPVISQFRWNDISNTPSTLLEYGIVDAISNQHISYGITQDNIQNWNNAYLHSLVVPTNSVEWNDILNTPTTLAGYGITDGDGGSGGGTLIHSVLSSLDYASSGHTGFQAELTDPVTGTGANNRVAVFTGTTAIEGDTGVTYDGTTLAITGNITATGEISAFAGSAPGSWWDSIPVRYSVDYTGGYVQLEGDADTPGNDKMYGTGPTGTKGWFAVPASGVSAHASLTQLDYASSGHSGFSPTIHNLVDTTNHPVTGLTNGHFLKATGATTYGFAAHGLTYSDVGAQVAGSYAASSHAHAWSDLTSGVPSTFTPSSHNNSAHSETYITSSALSPYAPLASPTFTGTVTFPSSTQVNSSGWLGINVSPTSPLHVSHSGSTVTGAVRVGDATTLASTTGVYLRSSTVGYVGTIAAGGRTQIISDDPTSYPNNGLSVIPGGNVGIGTTAPTFPLSFAGAVGDKIALYDNGSTVKYGFGIQSNLLQIYCDAVGDRVGIGYGRSGSFTETLTVKGSNVGIGTTAPNQKLEVNGANSSVIFRMSTNTPSSLDTTIQLGGYSGGDWAKSSIISTPNSAGWNRQNLHFCLANGNDNNTVTVSDAVMSLISYSSGNFGFVGIGTTTPAGKLSVNLPNAVAIAALSTTPNGALRIGANDTTGCLDIGSYAGDYSWIQARNTAGGTTGYPLLLNPLGANVGIGTTAPNALLQVGIEGTTSGTTIQIGSSTSTTGNLFFGDGGGAALYRGYVQYDHNVDAMSIGVAAATKIYINSSGNVAVTGTITATGEITAYYSSDRRLKQNINSFTALELIDKMNPKTFQWNDTAKELNSSKDDRNNYGLIAQELEEVLPELIHDVYEEYKAVDYIQLIPILIQAIKEQQVQINRLLNR